MDSLPPATFEVFVGHEFVAADCHLGAGRLAGALRHLLGLDLLGIRPRQPGKRGASGSQIPWKQVLFGSIPCLYFRGLADESRKRFGCGESVDPPLDTKRYELLKQMKSTKSASFPGLIFVGFQLVCVESSSCPPCPEQTGRGQGQGIRNDRPKWL